MQETPSIQQQHEKDDLPPTLTFGQKAAVFAPSFLVSESLLALLHAPLPLEVAALIGAFCLARKSPELLAEFAPFLPMKQRAARSVEHSARWSMTDRLMGKHLHVLEPDPEMREAEESFQWDDEPAELSPPRDLDALFLFSEVLATFQPSRSRIFLARTPDGKDLFCAASQLCHVAIAGNTGGGKSSIQRMLMLQLCKAGMKVLLLNPHYTGYDIENDEDWTPFEPYLVHPPMECRRMPVIEHYLKMVALDLIPKRLDRRAHSQPYGTPYFIVIDELPSIIRKIKEAPEYMRIILTEGRKVGVFLIVASQDFLVKTISPTSGGGSIRECYRTAFYVGGDATTGHVMLDMPAKNIPETALGKGIAMLRGEPQKQADLVCVPFVDNAALYRYLGPSTYQGNREVLEGIELASPEKEEPEDRRTHVLDTIVRLVQTDVLDDAMLKRLIEQLPVQREEEEEVEEEEVERVLTDQSQPPMGPGCLEPTPKPTRREVTLNEAILAWNHGCTTVGKLEEHLNISHHQAYTFYKQIRDMIA